MFHHIMHSLAEEILLEIFYILRFTLAARSRNARLHLPIAFTLSHISRQWRAIAINAPLLWTDIRITASLNLDALRTIISRSNNCEVDVSFLSSPSLPRNQRLLASIHLRDRATILTAHIAQWRTLRIITDNDSMQYIMNPVINVSLPRLRCLELKLVPSNNLRSVLYIGALYFNPRVFRSLILHQVAIHPAHPSQLSNLNSLHLSQTSFCGIDEFYLTARCAVSTAAISNEITAPSMRNLRHLTISMPSSSLPAHLTFMPSKLSAITLSHLRCTTPMQRVALMRLFRRLITAHLEELELVALDGGAWDVFLDFLGASRCISGGSNAVMHTNRSEFATLTRLKLKSLSLDGIDHRFADIFPNIEYLGLVDLDPAPLMALFRQDGIIDRSTLWKKLEAISIGRSEIWPPRS